VAKFMQLDPVGVGAFRKKKKEKKTSLQALRECAHFLQVEISKFRDKYYKK